MAGIFNLTTEGGTIKFRLNLSSGERLYPVTVRVSYPGGSYAVRGWDQRTVADADSLVADHEAPLNTPLVLDIVGGYLGGVLSTRTFTIQSSSPLLTDPVRGRGIPVTIQSWPDWQHDREGKAVSVSDSRFPVIIEGFERGATSTIKVIHNFDPDSARLLEEMLSDGSALRIRPACDRLPAAWVSVRGRARDRFSQRPDSAVVDTMELIHTAMPQPDQLAMTSTLQDLHDLVPTTLAAIDARLWPGAGLLGIALEDFS